MIATPFSYYEFFAGGGMARAGLGSRWAWQLVHAARSTAGRQRIFVVQMEKDAYVEALFE